MLVSEFFIFMVETAAETNLLAVSEVSQWVHRLILNINLPNKQNV